MDEDPDDPSFEPGEDPGQKKKTGFKPLSMVDMKPCEDLHRYLVDKFHSSTKSKTVSFEKIHLSTYKPTEKVASFITSEDRRLLWIKTFISTLLRTLKHHGISYYLARTRIVQLRNQERQNYPAHLCRRR